MRKNQDSQVRFYHTVFLFDENYTVREAVEHVRGSSTSKNYRECFRNYRAYRALSDVLDWIPDLDVNIHQVIVPGTKLVICSENNPYELYDMGNNNLWKQEAKEYFVVALGFVLAARLLWFIWSFKLSGW